MEVIRNYLDDSLLKKHGCPLQGGPLPVISGVITLFRTKDPFVCPEKKQFLCNPILGMGLRPNNPTRNREGSGFLGLVGNEKMKLHMIMILDRDESSLIPYPSQHCFLKTLGK